MTRYIDTRRCIVKSKFPPLYDFIHLRILKYRFRCNICGHIYYESSEDPKKVCDNCKNM